MIGVLPWVLAVVSMWPAGVDAQVERRPATEQDLDVAIRGLPASVGNSVYAKEKEVELDGERRLVRVSDYVVVGDDGKPSLRRNMHRTPEEFQQQVYLDCTTFATPVLHRMVRGEFTGFDQSKVNGYGSAVAAFYGLEKTVEDSVPGFLGAAESTEWRKSNAGVYFFDLRRGKLGHIGFLVVAEESVRHVQMSMAHEPGQLDGDGFVDYLRKTAYARDDASVSLHRITVEVRGEQQDD